MPSTFLGLNTGLSGLNYYQGTLNTTAHNISNADTKGYSRQQVLSRAAEAIRVNNSYGMMGTGVESTGITQLRNVYYDTKFRSSNAKLHEYSGIREQLSQLESYMNEAKSETGYTQLLQRFDGALQDLSSSPSNATYRTQFIQCANNFTDFINELATNYQNTQRDINSEIAIHVDTINSIASQIYTLNQQIMNIESRSGNAGDLRDQRELLVDQLSELVNVDVVETPIMFGTGANAVASGATRYEVRIGNSLLVDEMECRQLKVAAREAKINQNDIDGLYDVYWQGLDDTVGDKFNFNSGNVSGLIKGLLEARDGNNDNPFSGTIMEMEEDTANGSIVKINLGPAGADIDKLNLPKEGIITLNCKEYYYEGWEASYDSNGNLNDFVFKNLTVTDKNTGKRIPAVFDNKAQDLGKEGTLGDSIDCKGIPYYMQELNEFVRTFSKYMNDIYTAGADANGEAGLDFYTGTDINGVDYELKVPEGQEKPAPSSVSSTYYQLTALNWGVNQAIMHDQNKLVVSYKSDIDQGNLDAKDIVLKVMAGMKNQNMYAQGTPAQFLQSITTSLGVDIMKYKSFANNMDEVSNIINNQRLSVSSVDTNEEAANLIVYQNGYNLACKIISVMNEIYDKLINQTG